MVSEQQREDLKEEAEAIRDILQSQARRAFVLELTGTPKAGKTTTIAALESFFTGCGYRVRVLRERAAECPLPMKGHFFFNTWTTCSMMAEVLGSVDAAVDLIIVDRGFFDALVWLEQQHQRGQVSNREREVFEEFVLLDRWRTLTNLTVVAHVAPAEAIRRENIHRLVPKPGGSIMRVPELEKFNTNLAAVESKYKDKFSIVDVDANQDGVLTFAATVLEEVLPRLRKWADPRIVAVPRAALDTALRGRKAGTAADAKQLWETLAASMEVDVRSRFEAADDWVQLVACGVPVHDGKVFVFQRSEDDEKAKEFGPLKVWTGCHIEVDAAPTLDVAMSRVTERICTELHLAFELKPKLAGFAWDEAGQPTHLALFFRFAIHNEGAAASMQDKKFRRLRALPMTAMFVEPEKLRQAEHINNFEPWSVSFLTEIGVDA